jgi:hypothetical protein
VHNVHNPFGRTNTQQANLRGSPKAAIQGTSSKKIHVGHVVTTTPDHERVKANKWPTETARKH